MADLRLLPPSAEGTAGTSDGVITLSGHRALPAFDAPPAAVLHMPPAPALAPALPDRLLPVGGPPIAWEAAGWGQHDAAPPVPVFETSMDIAALVALSNCQHALLQVQELAIQHLMATGPDQLEPVTFAATALPEEPEVRIVEAVAIDEVAAPLPVPAVTFTREQLEVHASGRISEIFGPRSRPRTRYARQVRMPEPPLLLADRVVGIEGEPGERWATARSGPRPTSPRTPGTSTTAACPPAS